MKQKPQNWNNIFPSDSLNFEDKIRADERAKTLKEVLKYSRSNQVVSLYEVNIWLKAELKKLEY